MGKYMRKVKVSSEVAIMDVVAAPLGVRTRARALALQCLQKQQAQREEGCGGEYLELRSRRLEKLPLQAAPVRRCGGRKVAAMAPAAKEEAEASYGENMLESEAMGRNARETTPCSLINSQMISTPSTPGSTTRSSQSSHRRVKAPPVHTVPSSREINEYFAAEQQRQQQAFIDNDGETFISADDLRINLWNLEISSQSFNIVDVKPANMEDLTEVITCAEFHPTHCNTLAYSSSKGTIRLIDLRQSALCDNHAKLFEEHEAPGSRSFFTEIIASVSDIKFARGGRHILSRDYMTLKLWDLNMDSGPVATFQVHEYLRPKLCDLYENDSIFDKFECCLSGDGLRVATGSYSNLFRVFGSSPESTEASTLEASRNPMRRQVVNPARPARTLTSLTRAARRGGEDASIDANGNSYDLSTKLLHLAWHPTENYIACAAANSLYMYYA